MDSVIPTKTEIIDLFWRSVWTFLAAFIGILVGAGLGIANINALQSAELAGVGAVLTLVKVFASNKLLGTGTASEKPSAVLGLAQPVASNNATPAAP